MIPDVDQSQFDKHDWRNTVYASSIDGKLKDSNHPDMSRSRGDSIIMIVFIDSDHAGNQLTRRSRIGFLVFFHSDLVHWYYKRHTSVETPLFSSKFMAMKNANDYVCSQYISYK